jgi:hypothetical protein
VLSFYSFKEERKLKDKYFIGDNLNTYKEICALASDVNPELVYQFMHLANNNAVWQSRY